METIEGKTISAREGEGKMTTTDSLSFDLCAQLCFHAAKSPGYQIERSLFELNRTIKFDVVRSSNEIELTKNKSESNQIERSIKFDEVRF